MLTIYRADGPEREPAVLTVADVCALYLGNIGDGICPEVYADRKRTLAAFSAHVRDLTVGAAKRHHLKLWVMEQTGSKSNWSKRRLAGNVKAAFGWAVEMGFVESNPFAGVTFPQGDRGQPMEVSEFQAILRNSSPIFRRIMVALKFTGARPDELGRTEWIHLDQGCIVHPKHKTAKSTDKTRVIVLNANMLKLIDWIGRNCPHQRYVFVNQRGRRWTKNSIYCRLADLREKGHIREKTVSYGLRHGWISAAVQVIDLPTVAELAGHANIQTTMRYVHLKSDHLRASAGKVFGTSLRS
jgi:site-specific recombinase XerD